MSDVLLHQDQIDKLLNQVEEFHPLEKLEQKPQKFISTKEPDYSKVLIKGRKRFNVFCGDCSATLKTCFLFKKSSKQTFLYCERCGYTISINEMKNGLFRENGKLFFLQ